MSQTYTCPTCDYQVSLEAHEASQVGTPICPDCDVECIPVNTSPLEALAIELGLGEDNLDDLVHDCKSNEASLINNEGLSGQIDYLVEAMGRKELEVRLRSLAT